MTKSALSSTRGTRTVGNKGSLPSTKDDDSGQR